MPNEELYNVTILGETRGKRNVKKHRRSCFNEIVSRNGRVSRRTGNVVTKRTWGHKKQEVVENYHCTRTELIMISY